VSSSSCDSYLNACGIKARYSRVIHITHTVRVLTEFMLGPQHQEACFPLRPFRRGTRTSCAARARYVLVNLLRTLRTPATTVIGCPGYYYERLRCTCIIHAYVCQREAVEDQLYRQRTRLPSLFPIRFSFNSLMNVASLVSVTHFKASILILILTSGGHVLVRTLYLSSGERAPPIPSIRSLYVNDHNQVTPFAGRRGGARCAGTGGSPGGAA
jgi:hypothetical protein